MRAVVQRVTAAAVTVARRRGRPDRPRAVRARRRDPRRRRGRRRGQARRQAVEPAGVRRRRRSDEPLRRRRRRRGARRQPVHALRRHQQGSPPELDRGRPTRARRAARRRSVVDELRRLGATVATGRFRTEMQVTLVNDGPVTVLLERVSADLRRRRRSVQRPTNAARTSDAGRRSTAGRRGRRTTSRPVRSRHVRVDHPFADGGAVEHVAVRRRRARENPVGDTCTTQRPVSIARSRLEATCCVCTIVPV